MISYSQARLNLISAIRLVERAFKTRDRREPGRKEKLEAEARLTRIFNRAFRRQGGVVETWMEQQYWDRSDVKIIYDSPFKLKVDIPDLDFEEDEIGDLIRELLEAAKGGILLFGKGKPAIDYNLTNAQALKWARDYAYSLIKDITKTTRDVLQSVISAFVETPGMTIGDVISQLPFDHARSERIAITEITRSYAEGEMIAGREMRREFPDVRIIKTWFTNNDDLVCDICAPLDGMEVNFEDGFTTEDDKSLGLDSPPAHVNCRCWMETSTALAELGEEEASTSANILDLSGVTSYEDITGEFDKLSDDKFTINTHGLNLENMSRAKYRNTEIYYNNATRKQAEELAKNLESFRRNNNDQVFDKLFTDTKITLTEVAHSSGKNVLATGGGGKITVYGNKFIGYEELIHEAGHTAGNKDYIIDALRKFTAEGELSPTGYGRVNIDEDIAETIKTYFMDRDNLMFNYNNRFRLIRDFFNE
jgi:hypothetical protein